MHAMLQPWTHNGQIHPSLLALMAIPLDTLACIRLRFPSVVAIEHVLSNR